MKTKKTSSDGLTATKLTQSEAEVAHKAIVKPGTREVLLNPEITAARERMKKELQRRLKITKEDFTAGMLDAIDDAKIQADPMAQIAGWRELGKAHGHYEPKRVIIQHEGPVAELRAQLISMSDAQLAELTGEVIDGEFYDVSN